MKARLQELVSEESGAASVEYALLLSLLVIATIAAWQALGDAMGNMIQRSSDTIATGGVVTPSSTP